MKGEPNPHLMTMGSDAGQSFARAKGIAWPEVTANTRRKRGHRWAPMGLMVVAPDHVEGFIPATIKRKRCTEILLRSMHIRRRSPWDVGTSIYIQCSRAFVDAELSDWVTHVTSAPCAEQIRSCELCDKQEGGVCRKPME